MSFLINCYRSINIPNGITEIDYGLFSGCSSLAGVSIPVGVTSIKSGAFSDCSSLADVSIPSGITSIEGNVFVGCSSLTEINVAENNVNYCSEDGILFNADKSKLIAYPAGKGGVPYLIPNGVTSIGSYAFAYCGSLTSVSIPDSVTSIGNGAFSDCSGLTSVSIPDNVTSIGDYVFNACSSLISVIIPTGITSIGYAAFYECISLTDVYYKGTEEQWNTISINILNDPLASAAWHMLTASGTCGDNLIWTLDSEGMLRITGTGDMYDWRGTYEPWYRYRSSIKYADIGEGVTSIGIYAFGQCEGIENITIPDSVTRIGESAFMLCTGLKSVTIPDSVISIDYAAFAYCTELTSITIPSSVTSIS